MVLRESFLIFVLANRRETILPLIRNPEEVMCLRGNMAVSEAGSQWASRTRVKGAGKKTDKCRQPNNAYHESDKKSIPRSGTIAREETIEAVKDSTGCAKRCRDTTKKVASRD